MKLSHVLLAIAATAAYVMAEDAVVAPTVDSIATKEFVNENGETVLVDEDGYKQTVVDNPQDAMSRNMALADQIEDPTTPEAVRAAMPAAGKVYPYGLLLLENSCKLRRHFKGAREFTYDEYSSYPNLSYRFVGGLPRLRLFEDKKDLEINTVDTKSMTPAELSQMIDNLRFDPDYYKPKNAYVDVQLSKQTTSEEIMELLERFGLQRSFADPNRVFTIQETADEPVAEPAPFDMDAILNEMEESANGTVVSESQKVSHDEL
jgi:hypothetical protein